MVDRKVSQSWRTRSWRTSQTEMNMIVDDDIMRARSRTFTSHSKYISISQLSSQEKSKSHAVRTNILCK
eukprot:scaffold3713_cov78-Skeletonema_dohrnii-CCMP3373.AAC.2